MTLVEKPGTAPILCLDEVLNLAAARPLADALASTRGSDLTISAKSVRHLGAQCAQVLIAGTIAWRVDGHVLRIVDATPGFEEGVQLLGLETFFPDEETAQ